MPNRIGEMKYHEKLIDRILFLEESPRSPGTT